MALIASALLIGCTSSPRHESGKGRADKVSARQVVLGTEIARTALSLLGRPYRYGGEDPTGFDCSGLVHFVFNQQKINVPRTVAEQYRAALPVQLSDVIAGDVLFFKIDSSRISHVAIYAGQSRFIHAPQSGRQVELRMLDDSFYRSRLTGVGRLL